MIAFFLRNGTVAVRSAYLESGYFPPQDTVVEVWVDGDDLKGYPGLLWRKGEGGIVRVGITRGTHLDEFYNAKFQYPEEILQQFGDPK